MSDKWSNLAKVVYKRTYARNDNNKLENWNDTVERVIKGNIRNHNVSEEEINKLKYFMLNRKAMPAGRGLWFSGAPSHDKLGGAALNNCWGLTAHEWENFVLAQDLLMLGGGVGLSIEHRFVSKLSKVKKNVEIIHKVTKDADFIIPDSREGWCQLTHNILESFFVTGKSFTFSSVCLRGFGEKINGFGGVSSGPLPLIKFVKKLCGILINRQGKHIRPVDAMDIICSIGEMVVSGNVRRSAILIMGDPWDKEFLKSKRWDLVNIPTERAMANLSVVCENIEDLHPLFWETYKQGEPFGLINRKNVQKYGRVGELKKDSAVVFNPCAEACLEDGEPCNLQEIFLPNLKDENEFIDAAILMHRYGKRVTCEKYHNTKNDKVVKRNRRIGTGITGCLQSNLFNSKTLDKVYKEIQKENKQYSKDLNIPESIRTTVIKPSGTLSLLGDVTPGIHPAYSPYYIRRIRFSSIDPLVAVLKEANHPIELVKRFDGSLDHNTVVVDFYCKTPNGTPTATTGYDSWKQLEDVKMAQKYWADQSISVTVYYKKDEIKKVKEWLFDNFKHLKTISFLCHNDHGFNQAPLEEIDEKTYNNNNSKIKSLSNIKSTFEDKEGIECEGGMCPIK